MDVASSRFRYSMYVWNSETHKSGKLALILVAAPTFRISKQSGKNANDRRTPMFNWPDFWHDLKINLGFKQKPQPSLLALGVHWTTNVKWIPRLVAYRQLDNWTSKKHTEKP